MASFVVKLPDVGEGIAEAELVEWHVAVGDAVTEDQALADVMTDKATVELPSPVHGTIAKLGAEVGDVVPVGTEIVWIDTDGAAEAVADEAAETSTDEEPIAAVEPEETPSPAEATAAWHRSRTLAAPAVRTRAAKLGLDLATINGSGPGGRIVHDDLDRMLAAPPPPAPISAPPVASARQEGVEDEVEQVKIAGLRRNIAQRMQESTRRIPHFTYVEEIDVTDLERTRAELNRQYAGESASARPKLTVLPLLMRAVVIAVGDFPQMNARFRDDDGYVEQHRAVHLGIATQTAKGLMVPVVDHADRHDVWTLAAEVTRLSAAARDGTVTLQELHGSTITITSLGPLGGVVTTPVINYPEVAIIGVNKIVTRPVWVDAAFVPRQMMSLSSSFDHRVVDGYDAAQFVQRIKALLETPALLFVS